MPKFSQIPRFCPGLRRSWRAWVRTSSCWKLARWAAGTPAGASPDRCDPPRPAAARGRSAATWDLTRLENAMENVLSIFNGKKNKEKLQETMGFLAINEEKWQQKIARRQMENRSSIFFQWLLKMISIGAKKNLSAIEILTGNHKSRL